MDVLQYSATKEQVYFTSCLNSLVANNTALATCILNCFSLTPNTASDPSNWRNFDNYIPVKSDNSNVVCVFDASCFTLGGCCAWTVPSGVSVARFEMWGPGAPSAAGNCCGGAPWGGSGTFGTFTINVTPGCTYTLCAGCSVSYCGYCCGCTNYWAANCYCSGAPTFVTGYGLSNICAPGGFTDLVQGMCARLCSYGICSATPTVLSNPASYASYTNGCGLTICQCVTYCNPGSQPTNGAVSPQADWNVTACGCFTNCNVLYGKIPMMHQGVVMDTNNYGAYLLLPTYPKCGWYVSSSCCNPIYAITEYSVSSGTCNACATSLQSSCCCYQAPGVGGAFSHMMGGSSGYYGDRGRNGFVKVIYC
jgi:hypothetical protein